MPPKFDTSSKADRTYVTVARHRMDLEKQTKILTELLRDSMAEVAQLLYAVLGEEHVDRAIAQARAAEEAATANREAMVEQTAKSVMLDMQRFDQSLAPDSEDMN